jgi:hypothetical protein
MLPIALFTLAAALVPVRVDVPPTVDGHLDDAAWATAPSSSVFTQQFPRDGVMPTDATRVRVAYDDQDVYVAVECEQRVPPVARLTRRDREIDGDRVSIDLDTGHDRRSAFHFQVSAAGVLVDGLRYDDTELSTEWDDIWQADVRTSEHGWIAELRIPLRILRLHAGVDTWGFQVRRWVGQTGEIDEWAYSPRDAGGEVSRYGELGPFRGLEPHANLALVPFALSRMVRTDVAVRSAYGDGLSAAAGVDLVWRPLQNIAVAAAVLPDFAQIEADQVVINLTTTETEYPEKRPFFLQGLDVFQTPIQMLFTRRIGEVAPAPAVPMGVMQLRPTGPAPVLGAAKILGNTLGIDLGALSAISGSVDATTDAGSLPASPLTADSVVRMRTTRGGMTVGALATAHATREEVARYPSVAAGALCPGGDVVMANQRCTHDAYTAGLDGAWRSDHGDYVAGAQLAATQIAGGPPRQRPDGTIIESGDTGAGAVARVAKEGGTFRFDALYEVYSRRFDIDDLGYLSRANLQHASLDLEGYTTKLEGTPLIEGRARLELFWRQTLDGLRGSSGYQWNVSGTTRNMWHAFLEAHWRPHTFDDREFGDGRALEHSGKLGVELSVRTDSRSSVVVDASLYSVAVHGGQATSASSEIAIRPRDNIEVSIAPELMWNRGEPRFLEEDAFGPRFARQDVTSFGTTMRATWTITRDLTFQAYAQALLATIRYRDAFVADPALRVIRIADLRPAMFDPADYDGRDGALNANLVARWEYRPGSTAFLVFSHAQSPSEDGAAFAPRSLARGPASDVVLLKLSWAWLR